MSRETYEITTLANGTELCLVDTPDDDRLAVSIAFPAAGTNNSLPGKPGQPHLTEHLIFDGCETMPSPQAFRDILEADGAKVNAVTREEHMRYTLLAGENWDIALRGLVKAIEAPLFAPAMVTSERAIVREELTGYLNVPLWQLWPRLRKAVGYQTYNDPAEHLAVLDTITADDLREFHANTHRTAGMRVVATGSMGYGRAAAIQAVCADMQLDATPPSVRTQSEPMQPETPVIVNRPDRSNIYFRLDKYGLTTPALEATAMSTLLTGRLFGYQRSTISRAGRERHILYSIGGGFDADVPGKESFYVHGDISPTNARNTWQLVREALTAALDPVQAATDFAAVQRNAIGRASIYLADTQYLHRRAVRQFNANGMVLSSTAYLEALRSVTPDAYIASVGHLFRGGVVAVGAVGKNLLDPESPIVQSLQETHDFLAGLSR